MQGKECGLDSSAGRSRVYMMCAESRRWHSPIVAQQLQKTGIGVPPGSPLLAYARAPRQPTIKAWESYVSNVLKASGKYCLIGLSICLSAP